jgi:hypothetical protein
MKGLPGLARARGGGGDPRHPHAQSDGIETLVQLRALRPSLPVIVISGGDQTHTLGLLGDASCSVPCARWPSRSR